MLDGTQRPVSPLEQAVLDYIARPSSLRAAGPLRVEQRFSDLEELWFAEGEALEQIEEPLA
jgi:hypothetical protein